MSSSGMPAASFTTNVALGRSLVHRGSLQLLGHPPSAQGAFSLFLQAAQTFSLAVRQAGGPVEKADVQRELKAALTKAEACKAALKAKEPEGAVRRPATRGRTAPESQELVLLQSASVDSPWGKVDLPLASPFLPRSRTLPNPDLPAWAVESGGSYVPLATRGAGRIWRKILNPEDIQQDRIANCSFVASVQVMVAWNGRHGRSKNRDLLEPLLTPTSGDPIVFRLTLQLNGAPRTVHVDSLLPVTLDGEPLGISDTAQSSTDSSHGEGDLDVEDGWGLRLLEKGWMTLRGGWESAGSNSSIDLHALTGWVPEILALKDSDFKREQVWTRLKTSFEKGLVLMTLGTGRLSKTQIRDTGLIARHDYSVLDLIEDQGKRLVKILNPWKRKARLRATSTARDVLRAVRGPLDSISEDTGWSAGLRSALEVVGDERVFSMPWEVVIQVFDAAYLNWDPEMFETTVAVHSAWPSTTADGAFSAGLASQPQFNLQVREARSVWLLLNRHMSQIRAPGDTSPPRDFIGLRVFETEGASGVEPLQHTVFTDSNLHLVKLNPSRPETVLAVVVPRETDDSDDGRFSLTAFAAGPSAIQLSDPPPDLPFTTRVEGTFLGRSAGGSPAYPSFIDNPMYELTIRPSPGELQRSPAASLKLALAIKRSTDRVTERQPIGVNVKLLWGTRGRVKDLDDADIVLDSGGYRRELTLCSKDQLQSGTYTLIASAATPADEADFAIDVQCSAPVMLRPVPQEGAGLFSRTINGSWTESTSFGSPTFGRYWRNPSGTLRLHTDANVLVRLCAALKPGSSTPPTRLPLNVTIFASPPTSADLSSATAAGPERATSGPYTDAVGGASISQFRLSRGEYRLVWSTYAPGLEGHYLLRIWADSPFDWKRRPMS